MSGDLVPSVSIANLVNQRAAVLEKLGQAFDLIGEAAQIAGAAHLGMPRVTVSTSYSHGRGDVDVAPSYLGTRRDGSTWSRDAAHRQDLERAARLGVDAAAWQYLMHESGMRSLMDATAREKWDKAISAGDIPELTTANVRATFQMLHDSRGEIFERGVIACFKALSWHYKTNLPQKFGKRIVVTYLTGCGSYRKADEMDDLLRVLTVLDGKPEPDHRGGVNSMLSAAGLNGWPARPGQCENDYLAIRTFKNHNGHVTFKRPDLVEKMNLIIAKHYPGALPAPK
ncbi:MAG: DUF4942 domain-containing protein [Rubrivivax sp.]|nr:DUF4942 domain-containing protein [Rubrivivax sp.]